MGRWDKIPADDEQIIGSIKEFVWQLQNEIEYLNKT